MNQELALHQQVATKYDLYIFDVDGTLVKTRSGYPFRTIADDWEYLPGRVERLDRLKRSGAKIALATNQAGVAFGIFTREAMYAATKKIADGVAADTWYMSIMHPNAKLKEYRGDSALRKPKPGMLIDCIGDCNVPPNRTLMIGDSDDDCLAASAAGCQFQWSAAFFG